jgi:peptidoglycan/LPS O-acetylase OafA/YrhL
MGYHAGVSWLPGGMLGVDVFFVLSGFLITSLLLNEKRISGRVNLRRFWGRRVRRLLPAMAMLLSAMILWAHYLAPADSRLSLRNDAIATLGYVANWRFVASHQGYFDRFGPQSPLLHTWSLAVEEQFYLLWPLLLVLTWSLLQRLSRHERVRRSTFVVAACGAITSAALMTALSLVHTSDDRLYYGTDTRALPLLLGCCLAALRPPGGYFSSASWQSRQLGVRNWQLLVQVAGLLGLIGLALCWTLIADRSVLLYRGGFAVVAVAASGVLLSCAEAPQGLLAQMLSVSPLRYVGKISYGLYLYHWPVFLWLTFGRTGLRGGPLLGLRLGVTFAIAIASYHLIEEPIRRGALSSSALSDRLHVSRRMGLVATPALCVVLVGGLITGLTLQTGVTAAQLAANGRPSIPSAQPPKPKPPALTQAQQNALHRPIRVLLEGDSLAFSMGYWAGPAMRRAGLDLYDLGHLGCGIARGGPILDAQGTLPDDGDCDQWPTWRSADVRTYDPDVAVLLIGRWEVADRVHDGVVMHLGQPAYDAYISQELDLAIRVLAARGAKIVLATTPYFAQQEEANGAPVDADDPSRVDELNQLLRGAAQRAPSIASVVDLNRYLDPDGTYQASLNGVRVRTDDGVHISELGSRLVAAWMAPRLHELGAIRRTAQAASSDQLLAPGN